ncbi:hypothetical protein Leryth_008958 [Lithospermum erythrorhizon]|nr:hypothetical protein Leryth_008958 [Lithospermum erythrorhizon]
MQMDNNDKHHLGLSEENTKITSVLHPYGLPKIDLDHSHIRFDTLAEDGGFIGISSREEDHWIEDFSRGNSSIEFGSSAAERCSIPRHVDVWSEATSSESVEMLLKSVGQEEMLPGESIIEESDACDELGTLARQMELKPSPDGNRNDQDSYLEEPNVQPLDNSSGHNHGSDYADIDPKCSSHTQVEHSASGCSANLESCLVVRECNSQDKVSCNEANQPKPAASMNVSLNDNMEGTPVLGTQRCSDSSSQYVREDVEFSNDQDISSRQTTKGNSQKLHSTESCQNSEDLVLPESLKIKHSSYVCEKSFGGSEGDLKVDEKTVSSSRVDECEQQKDFLSPTSHPECSVGSKESSQGKHSQVDKRVFTISEGQIPGTEPELGIHIIDNLPVLADALQSAQSVVENIAENLNGRNGATENQENTAISSASSVIPVPAESSNSGKQDTGDMNAMPVILYNNAERLSTSSLVEDVKKKIEVMQTLESDKPSTINSESNVGSIGSNAVSHERSQGTTGDIAEQNEGSNLSSDVVPIHLDKTVDTVADVILEEETPSVKFLSQVGNETGTVSLTERSLSGEVSVEEAIRDDSSTCLKETRDTVPLNEGVTGHLKETLGFSDTIYMDSVPCDSKLVVGEGTEDVALVKQVETKIENTCRSELSEISGGGCFTEADKPSHNTASVISCSELRESDERTKVDPIESAAEHVSDNSTSKAGEVPLVPSNDGANEGSREERSFSFDLPPVAEKESGLMPSGSQKNHGRREVPQVTSIVTEGGSTSVGEKITSESKTRRGSAKSTKRNTKKGKNVRQPEDNTSCALVSQSGPARLLQFGVGITESSGRKSSTTPIPSSNLPDLNTSSPTSALFHQPFTDLQQVQLRAQIFVYGSLIQGIAPDEACMVSAFGTSGSDGSRISWEPKWRTYMERLCSQKTVSNNYSTPVQSRSGTKGQDKSSKQTAPQSKDVPCHINLFGNKEISSLSVKPMIPLSSPLWNLSTPLSDSLPPSNMVRGGAPKALPPLHPGQTPSAQTFGGQTSWLSPAPMSPIPGPWVSSSRFSAVDLSSRLSSSPSAETVKLTPLRDSSLAISSPMKDAFKDPISHRGVSSNLMQDASMQKLTSTHVDAKSRKRRKSSTTEASPQNSLSSTPALPYSDAITSSSKEGSVARLSSISSYPTTTLIGGHFSTTVAATASQVVAVDSIQRADVHMDYNSILRGELKQVEKAKQAGEEAVAHAADLVSRCQSVWGAMKEQKNSSLAPDRELQLSSSAAAMAAAASVAKAAAAAANLASKVALHIHQVAIHVLHGNAIPVQESGLSESDVANSLDNATSAAGNRNDAPNSIISADREASRKRVEAALAASQHAENLDAIVKSAELAAEAVSQAGRVVSMGKPLPLSFLVEAGPENYWRGDSQLKKCSTEKGDKKDIGTSKEVCKQVEGPSNLEVGSMAEACSIPRDIAREVGKNTRVDEVISASHVSSGEKDSPVPDYAGVGFLASDHVDAESEPLQDSHGSGQQTASDDSIKENCTVEVFKNGGCFKGAWYSAKVLSLNDDKALVCFTDLQSDKDSDALKEWIPLEGEENKVPNIRVAHPISGMHFDRPRKRYRAALTEHQWSVGDRVDAFSENCWRGGVITEQHNNDPTTFTVHFPAFEETSAVKAWHLRPTLTWKNGKWIELLSSRQTGLSQGDPPRGKRLKLGHPLEVKGKGEIPKTDNLQLENVDEPKLLPLSSTEKVFNIGSNRGNNMVDAPRMMRSGLQKEGLKFFGVPRPGKKRKFMEVSKNIVSELNNKKDLPNDSSKLSQYLPPRTGPRGFKNGSNVDVKEKKFAESKLKAPYTRKLPGSNHEAAVDVNVSTQSLPSDSSKKASNNINSERSMKGKLAVASGRIDAAAEDNLLPDSTGPRRSNRKIHPTSRLLEGLQTSLITSKIPSASHGGSHRLQSKGASRPKRYE